MTQPKPLIQSNIDLRSFEFMPLDVVRLRDSDFAALVNAEAFRAGILLISASWHQVPAGSLPNDDRILSNLAGFGRVVKEWKKYKDEAMHGWVLCDDNRYYHKVVCEKAVESWNSKQDYNYKKFAERLRKANGKANEADQVQTPSFDTWINAGMPDNWVNNSKDIPNQSKNNSAVVPMEFQQPSAVVPTEFQEPSNGIPQENALKGTEHNIREHNGQVTDINIDIGETSSPDDVQPKSENQSKPKPVKFNPINMVLPAHIDREIWVGFVEMRNLIKKPMTERAASQIIEKLDNFGRDPLDKPKNGEKPRLMDSSLANISLDNSTLNNWQDVFMPKDETRPLGFNKSPNHSAKQSYQPRFSNNSQQHNHQDGAIQGEYRNV